MGEKYLKKKITQFYCYYNLWNDYKCDWISYWNDVQKIKIYDITLKSNEIKEVKYIIHPEEHEVKFLLVNVLE